MERLEKKLREDQARFNRKVRHLLLLVGAAALMVGGILIYLQWVKKPEDGQDQVKDTLSRGELEEPMVLQEGDPDDPSQLVPASLLYPERHANPLKVTPQGKTTLIDKDLLGAVIGRLKEVSQQELEGRVDRSITWETFLDETRREQVRGRVCQFRGTLRRFTETKGVKFPDRGVETLYEGQIQGAPGEWYSFYCFRKPEPEIDRSDVAVVTGVFYKLIKYSSREGKDIVSPLVVAPTLTSRPAIRPGPSVASRVVDEAPPWALYLGLAAIVLVVFVALSLLMRRKPNANPALRRAMRRSASRKSPEEGDEQEEGEDPDNSG